MPCNCHDEHTHHPDPFSKIAAAFGLPLSSSNKFSDEPKPKIDPTKLADCLVKLLKITLEEATKFANKIAEAANPNLMDPVDMNDKDKTKGFCLFLAKILMVIYKEVKEVPIEGLCNKFIFDVFCCIKDAISLPASFSTPVPVPVPVPSVQ